MKLYPIKGEPLWSVSHSNKGGWWLHWRGDGLSASYLAELLSEEDEGRISEADVIELLRSLASGLQRESEE